MKGLQTYQDGIRITSVKRRGKKKAYTSFADTLLKRYKKDTKGIRRGKK